LGKTDELPVQKLVKGLYSYIPRDLVNHGNTSIRNTDEAKLVWKGSPSSNGFGYFQRNRDIGQVSNVAKGRDVQLDALTLGTSKGNNVPM
jgi:hypothetical protein